MGDIDELVEIDSKDRLKQEIISEIETHIDKRLDRMETELEERFIPALIAEMEKKKRVHKGKKIKVNKTCERPFQLVK